MRKIRNKILDFYLKQPLLMDGVIVLIFWLIPSLHPFVKVSFTDKSNIANIYSNLIGTCISLAGFILAALTIIVTFRSNIKSRGFKEAENALDFILSSDYYKQIVSVYKKAIVEFVLITVVLYTCWILIENIKSQSSLTKIALSGAFGISTTLTRSLWVLFKILQSEHVVKK